MRHFNEEEELFVIQHRSSMTIKEMAKSIGWNKNTFSTTMRRDRVDNSIYSMDNVVPCCSLM